jgi:hypothetical protein
MRITRPALSLFSLGSLLLAACGEMPPGAVDDDAAAPPPELQPTPASEEQSRVALPDAGDACDAGARWTCAGTARTKCAAREECPRGCLPSLHGDASCIAPTTAWTCNQSAYQGTQYWTCSGGNLYKCDDKGPVTVHCAAGCVTGPLATDDVCNGDAPPPPPGFLLPLACNRGVTITQGNNSPFSHNGLAAYAFDFGVSLSTPLLAARDGKVILARSDVKPGNPCYSGGGSSCANTVNYVVVDHGDGTATLYLHLNAATVGVGQLVKRGDQVGLSGGTGWSTGPHAHVQRQGLCGSWWCQSVPLSFGDVPGGVPVTGQVVTSKNGC